MTKSIKGKADSNKKGGGSEKAANNDKLVEGMPIAKALMNHDTASIAKILQDSLPKSRVKVENVTIKKSVGEAFTGGRSTPVYHISCQVVRPGNDRLQRHFVAKLVLMPGDDTEGNCKRPDEEIIPDKLWIKRESYAVERRFYNCAAPRIREFLPPMGPSLTIPKLLASDHDGSKQWPAVCFLMNDLSSTGYPCHPEFLSPSQAKQALRWIATFHCLFWAESDQDSKSNIWKRELWNRGGHWTEKTRNGSKDTNISSTRIGQQWAQTVRWLEAKHPAILTPETKGLGKRIEAAAGPIAEFLTLQATKGPLGTLIHGDFKAANMFLRENTQDDENDAADNVAVLDFQFSGLGIGMEDVAYFLFPDARGDYFGAEDEILECYYDELVSQLMLQGKGGPSTLSLQSCRALYDLSRLDILRHLLEKGWVGSTQGDAELISAVEAAVNRIDGGIHLGSKEEYAQSLKRYCWP